MGKEQIDRIQHLFHAALEFPEERRELWLRQQCGDDQLLLDEIHSLLKHDSPAVDPLEDRIDHAIADFHRTLATGDPQSDAAANEAHTSGNENQFLSRLAGVGILSGHEISAIEQDLSSDAPSSNPRLWASRLVADGKLTEYQAAALLKGQPSLLIDKYLILDLIDTGGMGTVFKAIHRPMNRVVAIKMIAKHLLTSLEQPQRFLREVRVAATLENVNIVRAYDADQSKGVHFLVMEYVRGENLTTIVRRDGPMPVEQAVDCIRQAAHGLRYAHQRGIVHRDVKPSNLMQTDDMLVKVLDLGLADVDESFCQLQQSTIVADDSAPNRHVATEYHTEVGAVLGTASFMAPEQYRDAGAADPRSDIYSLGCTLYYLLTGEPPYKAGTSVKILARHRDSEIPSIRARRPDVPHSVDAIYRRMLAKQPGQRFHSTSDLIAAIEDCELDRPEKKKGPHREVEFPNGGATLFESSQGRAERLLAERAVLWNVRRQYRHLPSWREHARILLLTDKRKWTQAQRRMMGSAGIALALRLGLLGLLIATVCFIGTRVRDTIVATKDATRAADLTEMLRKAKADRVPAIIADLEGLRQWADPLIADQITKTEAGSDDRLHLTLAIRPMNDAHVVYLSEQLLVCAPEQIPMLCSELRPYKDRIADSVWDMAFDQRHGDAERFSAFAALSKLTPSDKRWDRASGFVAAHLTGGVTNMEFGQWCRLLQPVRKQLSAPLAAIHADRTYGKRQREAAALVLADYCRDQPHRLFESVLISKEVAEYSALLCALRPHANAVKQALIAEAHAVMPENASVNQRDAHWTRRSIAATVLVHFGWGDEVWSLLQFNPDPSLRSLLIQNLGRLRSNPITIANRLEMEEDVSVRRSLLQVLGELDSSLIKASLRQQIVNQASDLYADDPDPGIHSSAFGMLRRWGENLPDLAMDETTSSSNKNSREASEAVQRGWYINRVDQTMIIINASESDGLRDSFAICDHEVSVADFLRFDKRHSYDRVTAPTESCPVSGVDHYKAAEYCNWLSQQNDIPRDQWVYEPNEYGAFAEGMTVKEEYAVLEGYRLPTGAEWEYACRAGTKSGFSFGEPISLLPRYSHCGMDNLGISRPIATRLPNDFGLFDMHGNLWEKVEDPISGARSPIRNSIRRRLRGGGFVDRENVRSFNFHTVEPMNRYNNNGFRPVVSITSGSKSQRTEMVVAPDRDKEQSSPSRFALMFDGHRAHVRIPDLTFHGDHPITLECYVTPERQNSREASVIANVNFAGIGLGLDNAGHWQAFWAQRSSGPKGYEYAYAKSQSPAILADRVHVAAVFTDSEVTLFVDGRRADSTSTGKHVASEFGFYIGADPRSDDTPEQFFHGAIDEVRVSGVARYSLDFTPSERFVSDADTLSLYHMDAGKGNNIRDSSEHRHDGWTGDAAWISAPPPSLVPSQ